MRTIDQLEEALAERTAALEAKRTEVEAWIAKRDAFMALAEERLVGIYEKMRPDAAAEQIARIQPLAGAAIMMKLKPSAASAILKEMPADDAARLASLMIDSGLFDPAVRKILKLVKGDPLKVSVGTAELALVGSEAGVWPGTNPVEFAGGGVEWI